MPRIFKTSMYFVDATGNFNSKEFMKNELETFADNVDIEMRITDLQISEEFEWHDDLTINFEDALDSDFEEYFEQPTKKYPPGIRPVNDDPDKKTFGPGTPAAKIIPKIIIDTRIYTDDFKTAVDDMRDYIKLGYLCNLTSIKAEYGTTDFKLEVFKR